MSQQELIEAVLREVTRVLAARGVSLAPAPSSGVAPSLPRQAEPAPVPAGGGDLTGKQVVIQKDLLAFIGGTVRVAKTAVLTPLALDYAREKGITLVRTEPAAPRERAAGAAPAAVVGLAVEPEFPGGAAVPRAIIEAKGFTVREFTAPSYAAAVTGLGTAVAAGAVLFGACLERTGMRGPIIANRSQAIRAVHCRDLYEARAARVDIGANVVVLDAQSDPSSVLSGFTGLE